MATFVIGKHGDLFEANPIGWTAFRRGGDGKLVRNSAGFPPKAMDESNVPAFRNRTLRAALENQLDLSGSPR
jgi:hypothetical protein